MMDEPEKGTIYYLAGPMTGIEEYNFPAFDKACELLEGRGLTIYSPHRIDHGETPETRGSLHYSTYLRAGYRLLLDCQGIIMLPNWQESKGAYNEYRIARSLDFPVFEIMSLEDRWWSDPEFRPLLFLEKRATRLLDHLSG
jgi:hypothetical protein